MSNNLYRRQVLSGLSTLPLLTMPASDVLAGRSVQLEIEGNHFTYDGQKLRLTGVAVGDPLYIRANRTIGDYKTIARSWSANCVRISVLPGHWRADLEGTRRALAREVAAARAERLFVIIDWHAIGFPGYYEPLVPAEWGLPTDISLSSLQDAAGFWDAVARQYANDPCVLFELWNEPVAEERLWVANGKHWPIFHQAWTDIIRVIRKRADNVVLCAGGYWAHDLVGMRNHLIEDGRTAYVWHSYPNAERDDFAARLATLGDLYRVKPIVVTEWGFCPDCKDDLYGTVENFGRPFVEDFLVKYGLSHTAWCFSQGAMPNLLNANDGPSEFGRFVKDALAASARSKDWTLTK
ncbi:hypothetical protein EPK99_01960 [Neorhizobium lilium]|uniref:Glycoside hydrolase family 5 domain-containing protein n=1 Tax=Neorhizobium lilium TaxID=2503024 RepID=A0A444LLB6_9HYPH|nr:cellulase family glycosylhydrolase [Neorhizobium lilium]RWX81121.1 hypothetical protein EPK99_01960 [Neorhizobium lilium]